jgi:hypothetical protein
MAELKSLGGKALNLLKKPAVSHALLALALKSKFTAALVPLAGALLGLQ